MSLPDNIVEEHGVEVKHIYVESAVFEGFEGADSSGFNDNLDVSNSTIREESVKAIISNPSERLSREFSGLIEEGSKTATVKSDLDVKVDREGRPDRFRVGNALYVVDEVVDDSHSFFNDVVNKKTLILNRLSGR